MQADRISFKQFDVLLKNFTGTPLLKTYHFVKIFGTPTENDVIIKIKMLKKKQLPRGDRTRTLEHGRRTSYPLG